MTAAETRDAFLGGVIMARQPVVGYRAATDPVFLAAACTAGPQETVLELGCGVGIAALCLGRRVPGVALTGVEVQQDYAELARRNAAENGVTLEVVDGDIRALPAALRARSFDHVIFNPPFYPGGSVVAPGADGRATAHVDVAGTDTWCDAALRRLRPGGTVTMIQRAERLAEILAALAPRAGGLSIRPVTARTGRAAGRVLVRGIKGSRAPLRLLDPFVVHDGATHLKDADDYSEAASAVLRDGAALDWT